VLQKFLVNLDPMMHDVGPANIKPMTAAGATGTTTTSGMAILGPALTTDAGSAGVLTKLVIHAESDLAPFLSGKSIEEQTQIMTDYLREGENRFWQDNGNHRHMTPEQVEEWRKDPEHFRMPDGSKPQPLKPNKPIDKDQMKQVEQSEEKTRPSTDQQMLP
jgi:hypothetical protein